MSSFSSILPQEMPRERIMQYGVETLTDVELLAILLRTGSKEKHVLELSREVLEYFPVGMLSRRSVEDLMQIKGISTAKACQVLACFELARRLSLKGSSNVIQLTSTKDVFEYVFSKFSNLSQERVLAVFVDTKNQVLKTQWISQGGIDYSIVESREVVKSALQCDASGFFLVHNHPSGNLKPSEEDLEITKSLKTVCDLLNIRFIDHLIIGGNEYYSFHTHKQL